MNQANLQRAWNVAQITTRDDWDDWMRRVSVELLRESPSPALRACSQLAQVRCCSTCWAYTTATFVLFWVGNDVFLETRLPFTGGRRLREKSACGELLQIFFCFYSKSYASFMLNARASQRLDESYNLVF